MPPLESGSGEIFVKLDWSTLAVIPIFGGTSTPSVTIAEAAAEALTSTALIPELGGRALAELPLHLLGHSRGSSVVTELARLLGADGIWVDQVTTMDPRPVATFGDPPLANYANVLFADNYWQAMGDGLFVPNGEAVAGAYNRQLLSLDGGYSSSHSDAHLWYHGTLDLGVPVTDSMATITAAERATWWTAAEVGGAATGYHLSRLGGGDRLSESEPGGPGAGRVSDGFNRAWELGGGVASNRTALPANSGEWPNLIVVGFPAGGPPPAGGPVGLDVYYQSGAGAAGEVELTVFLDPDGNPWNGNGIEIGNRMLANSGTGAVGVSNHSFAYDSAGLAPGTYTVFAKIGSGARSRYLGAPGGIQVGSDPDGLPSIDRDSLVLTPTNVVFDVLAAPGQNVAVQASINLVDWVMLETRLFTGGVWTFTDTGRASFPARYYRPVLLP